MGANAGSLVRVVLENFDVLAGYLLLILLTIFCCQDSLFLWEVPVGTTMQFSLTGQMLQKS